MDNERFDSLTRAAVAAPASRRVLARGLAGALLAGVLARLGRADAVAACGKVGEACQRDGDCCEGARCGGGTCRCRAGLTNCGGRCRDLATHRNHCGACFNACVRREVCSEGTCLAPVCPVEAPIACGGRCCGPEQRCLNGVCRTPPLGSCPAEAVLCSNTSRCEAAGSAALCQCGKTTAGAVVCLAAGRDTNHFCADCVTDDDCAGHGGDFLCVPNGCTCGRNACVRWCPTPR